MKRIIREEQRGFLIKNGTFVKMIAPGKYRVKTILGEKLKLMDANGLVNANANEAEIASYMRDNAFVQATVGVEVPDGKIAMHFTDGRLKGSLQTGSYRFWNIFQKNTFELLDISSPSTENVPRKYFNFIPLKEYVKTEVANGEQGLLFVDGKVEQTLSSGTYFFWNSNNNVSIKKYDLRIVQIEVPGQEILTSDKVSLRLNFVCSYRIIDSVQMETNLSDPVEQIYSTVQLALRQYIGRFRLDELLEQKNEIASFVLEKLREAQGRLYVEFVDTGLKDIILPGEIRDIMNTVLVAEKKAQANVIARREEVASTRSLLNTAKLLDENATLAKLKEMESLERIFDKVGNISVSGGDGLLKQLKEIVGTSR